jgi:hypothetical protein
MLGEIIVAYINLVAPSHLSFFHPNLNTSKGIWIPTLEGCCPYVAQALTYTQTPNKKQILSIKTKKNHVRFNVTRLYDLFQLLYNV